MRDTRDPRIVMPGAIYGEGYRELGSHCFAYIHATEVGGTHPALIEAMGRGALVLYRNTPENAEVAGGAGIPFEPDELAAKLRMVLEMSEEERAALRPARHGSRARALFLGSGDGRLREAAARAESKIEAVPAPYRCYVVVSREQIARNYRNVRSVVGPGVEVAGVVKADAYGHGALEVSRVLAAEGANWLAVSSVEEGVGLRRGGIQQARILVMGGFLPYEGEALVEHDLTPAVHSLDQMRLLDRLRGALPGKPIPYHLKIDSGMGRLGTRAAAAEILAALAETRTRGWKA